MIENILLLAALVGGFLVIVAIYEVTDRTRRTRRAKDQEIRKMRSRLDGELFRLYNGGRRWQDKASSETGGRR